MWVTPYMCVLLLTLEDPLWACSLSDFWSLTLWSSWGKFIMSVLQIRNLSLSRVWMSCLESCPFCASEEGEDIVQPCYHCSFLHFFFHAVLWISAMWMSYSDRGWRRGKLPNLYNTCSLLCWSSWISLCRMMQKVQADSLLDWRPYLPGPQCPRTVILFSLVNQLGSIQ
jgi:hypothetical protein